MPQNNTTQSTGLLSSRMSQIIIPLYKKPLPFWKTFCSPTSIKSLKVVKEMIFWEVHVIFKVVHNVWCTSNLCVRSIVFCPVIIYTLNRLSHIFTQMKPRFTPLSLQIILPTFMSLNRYCMLATTAAETLIPPLMSCNRVHSINACLTPLDPHLRLILF